MSDKENHSALLSCKVRREYAEQIKARAAEQGVAVNAILKGALDSFMGNKVQPVQEPQMAAAAEKEQPVAAGDLVVTIPAELAGAIRSVADSDGQSAAETALDTLSMEYLGRWWSA